MRHHWLNRKIRINLFAHKGYWFHGRRREADEMRAVRVLISPGDSVVEVGGHIGYITLWFHECAGSASNGSVIVFEPGSNNLPYIRQNLANIGNVHLIEKGCGSVAGQLEFFEDSLTGQNNSFVSAFEGLESNINAAPNVAVSVNKRSVEVVRLDEELDDYVPDFIKIDVEGFELAVLRGASGWYDSDRKPPIIMIEVQSDHDAIETWMHERGYNLFNIEGQEIATIPRTTVNLFALHREKHATALSR